MNTRTRSLLLGAILLLALVLRLYRLDYKSLWLDEAYTWHYAVGSFHDCIFTEFSNPPGSYVLWWGAVRLFGDSQFGLRFPSAIAGVLAVWLLFRLARRLFDDSTALWAALFLAISSFSLRFTQEARTFGFLACAVLGSVEALVLLIERPTNLRLAAYILISAIGLHLHYVFGFVVIGHNVLVAWVWWVHRNKALSYLTWMAAQLWTGVLFLPWFVVLITHLKKIPNTDYYRYPWGQVAAMFFSFVWAYPTVTPGRLTEFLQSMKAEWERIALFLLFFVPLAVLGVREAWKRRGVGPVIATTVLVPFAISLALATAGSVRFTSDRYLGFVCPFWMMLLAAGAGSLPVSGLRPLARCGLVAVAYYSLQYCYYPIRQISYENWRDAADYLRPKRKDGDLVCFYEPYMSMVYNYYDRKNTDFIELPDATDEAMRDMEERVKGRTRVWLVQGHVPTKIELLWPVWFQRWSGCDGNEQQFPMGSSTQVWEFVPRK